MQLLTVDHTGKGMQMKTRAWMVLAVNLLVFMGSTMAADGKLACEAQVAVKSKHIWRGQRINKDFVFQPGATVAYGKLSGGVEASIGLTDAHGRKYEVERADFFVAWSEPLDFYPKVNYSVGLMHYNYPRGDDETTEVFGRLDFDMNLSPSVACYFESDDADGAYICASIARTVQSEVDMPWGKPLVLDLGAKLGWGSSNYNLKYWGVAEGQVNDLVLSATMPLSWRGYSIKPELAYAGAVGKKIKDSARYGTDNTYVYLGVGISKAF